MDLSAYKVTRLTFSVMIAVSLTACSATSDMGTQGSPSNMPAIDVNNGSDTTSMNNIGGNVDTPDTPAVGAAQEESGSVDTDALVANAGNVPCDASASEFRDTMLAMVNASRQLNQQCGSRDAPATGTVQWNDQLSTAAMNHADDMVTVNFFDHTGSDGLGVADRAEAAGYNWRAVGENIAAGQRSIGEVHQGWLDSPGHCRNIMNSLYTEIGAACIDDDSTDFGTYWVVVFGTPR